MKLNINNKNSVLFLWFADWFWPSLSTSFQWCVDKQQPTNLLSLKCSRGEGGPTSYVTSSLFWQSGKGKMILCEVRVVLATLRCCSDPVSTSTREHLAWHQSLPKRPCSDSRGLYLYDHQMSLCRSWFLLPPPRPPTMEYHRVWTWAASVLPAVSLIHPESRRFHLPPICPGCSVSFVADTQNKTKYIILSSFSCSRILSINQHLSFLLCGYYLFVRPVF